MTNFIRLNHLLFYITSLSCSLTAIAQLPAEQKKDSLLAIWNDASQADTTRLNAIQSITSEQFKFEHRDSALYYTQMQYDFAASVNKKRYMILALNIEGSHYLTQGDLDKSLEIFSKGFKLSKELEDKRLIAKSENNLGNYYSRKGDLTKALEYYLPSLKMLEALEAKEEIVDCAKNIGSVYFKKGELDEALLYLIKARKICEEIKDLKGQAGAQNIIASIYKQQGDPQKALEIYELNLENYKKLDFKPGIAGTLSNIGSIQKLNGDIDIALNNYQIALNIFEEINNSYGISGVSSVIGNLYLEQKKYPLALKFIEKSLKIVEETGNKEGIINALTLMAGVFEDQGNHTEALSYSTRALKLSQETGTLQWTSVNYQLLADIYKSTGKFKQALEMTELFMETRDSLNRLENQKAVIESKVQAEYDKQKALDDRENEKVVAVEVEKTKAQQRLSLAIGMGLLLISLLALGIFNRLKVTRKQKGIIEEQKIKVEQSEKYKQQFLANMSHEIRTPMHAISGMVKILNRNEHLPEQEVFLNAMKTSSENLVVILNDVLDLSKIEAGKLDIESVQMNPLEVMENVVQILKYKAEEKGLLLICKAADDVPSLVMGDPTRLNQILMNLAGNAIKFTEKGKVEIIFRVENEKLVFSIMDTGIGISKDHLEGIFEAFEQIKDPTSRNFGGTGLGLNISKQLVELQQGRIWAESEVGKGSVFYVQLPLTVAVETTISKNIISAERLKKMLDSLRGIRILLAEDNPFNQMIAQDDLSHYIKEVKIEVVENGARAVEKFETGSFDLILMDVQMPEMNGFEATQEIRKMERSKGQEIAIPIIAMTASLLKTEIDSCYAAGMDNYIPKPYTLEELIGPIFKEVRA